MRAARPIRRGRLPYALLRDRTYFEPTRLGVEEVPFTRTSRAGFGCPRRPCTASSSAPKAGASTTPRTAGDDAGSFTRGLASPRPVRPRKLGGPPLTSRRHGRVSPPCPRTSAGHSRAAIWDERGSASSRGVKRRSGSIPPPTRLRNVRARARPCTRVDPAAGKRDEVAGLDTDQVRVEDVREAGPVRLAISWAGAHPEDTKAGLSPFRHRCSSSHMIGGTPIRRGGDMKRERGRRSVDGGRARPLLSGSSSQ